jgi:hypothetical protein
MEKRRVEFRHTKNMLKGWLIHIDSEGTYHIELDDGTINTALAHHIRFINDLSSSEIPNNSAFVPFTEEEIAQLAESQRKYYIQGNIGMYDIFVDCIKLTQAAIIERINQNNEGKFYTDREIEVIKYKAYCQGAVSSDIGDNKEEQK